MTQKESYDSEIDGVDIVGIESAVRQILQCIGEDIGREGLKDTPVRVARLYSEMFSGLNEDPADLIDPLIGEDYFDPVLISDIPFHSVCEHHLLPFTGFVHVAYRPSGKVIGASKVTRLVDSLSRKPQIQERLTSQIADVIHQNLDAEATLVYMSAEHMCMTIRGVEKKGSKIVTLVERGNQNTVTALRDIFTFN